MASFVLLLCGVGLLVADSTGLVCEKYTAFSQKYDYQTDCDGPASATTGQVTLTHTEESRTPSQIEADLLKQLESAGLTVVSFWVNWDLSQCGSDDMSQRVSSAKSFGSIALKAKNAAGTEKSLLCEPASKEDGLARNYTWNCNTRDAEKTKVCEIKFTSFGAP